MEEIFSGSTFSFLTGRELQEELEKLLQIRAKTVCELKVVDENIADIRRKKASKFNKGVVDLDFWPD